MPRVTASGKNVPVRARPQRPPRLRAQQRKEWDGFLRDEFGAVVNEGDAVWVQSPTTALWFPGQVVRIQCRAYLGASVYDLPRFEVSVTLWDFPGLVWTTQPPLLKRRVTPEEESARSRMRGDDFERLSDPGDFTRGWRP